MKGEVRPARLEFLARLFAGSILAVTLAGCKMMGSDGPETTGSISSGSLLISSDLSHDQALAAVQQWGAAYSRDGKDKIAALNYAAALKAAGQTEQAVAVMRKAAIYHPDDREVLAAFGKALAANGQFQEALGTVRRAQLADNPDWQLLATEGGILNSVKQHDAARTLYRQALVMAPGEPQILNNLGMSYVLTGELDLAEETLRQAAAAPNATLKVRENLALVLRLQGEGTGSASAAAPQAGVAGDENIWAELTES